MSRTSLFLYKNPRNKPWKIRELQCTLSKCRLEGRILNVGNLFVIIVARKENHYQF